MKLTFDPAADAAFVYLDQEIGPGAIAHTHMCDVEIPNGAIILAFDADDRLVGMEILGATKLLSSRILQRAVPPG